MRSLLVIAGCVLLTMYSGRSEAQINAASFGTRTVQWVKLTNITWTDTPEIHMQNFYGIGVMRNYAGGPGWTLGATAWNDAPITPEGWYVAWHTYVHGTCLAAGWYYTGGAHRIIDNNLNVITHPNSPTYGGYYVSPCSA